MELSKADTCSASVYWTGDGSQKGTTTSSGIPLKNGLNDTPTAAHKTLPFGRKIHVTNIKNNKDVILQITDRGPFNDRCLDLNRAAAHAIDCNGLCRVKID